MKSSSLNRLEALEKIRESRRKTHFRWVKQHETKADLEEWCNRLIAEGKASADDRVVYLRWKWK
jgi:hypothetical protein